MKQSVLQSLVARTVTLAVIVSMPALSSFARPGGVYKGTSINNALTPVGPPPIVFEATPITLRLPNGKGRIKGTLRTTALVPPAPGDVPITGRVRKSVVRQGGNKISLKGKWTWDFVPLGTPTTATGKFSIGIRKSGRKYRIAPNERVTLNGAGPPVYSFTSKVKAKK